MVVASVCVCVCGDRSICWGGKLWFRWPRCGLLETPPKWINHHITWSKSWTDKHTLSNNISGHTSTFRYEIKFNATCVYRFDCGFPSRERVPNFPIKRGLFWDNLNYSGEMGNPFFLESKGEGHKTDITFSQALLARLHAPTMLGGSFGHFKIPCQKI